MTKLFDSINLSIIVQNITQTNLVHPYSHQGLLNGIKSVAKGVNSLGDFNVRTNKLHYLLPS
jgi:hypothetical protein